VATDTADGTAERIIGLDGPDEATFVLSLDTELIWGSFHHTSPAEFEAGYPNERRTIRAILELLERYEISATWAVVGHLFLERCERNDSGLAHPELVHPKQSFWGEDWYSRDPCSSHGHDPLWYGPDILDLIQGAKVRQEIGSHSFAHPRYGDREFTREAAISDLDACLAAARARGIELRSFVFPGNSEGYHRLLQERGFRAYRGIGPEEGRIRDLPARLQRPVRLATQVLGTAPLVGRPVESLPGLWDIPASMLLLTRTGLRRLNTHAARLRKVRAGIAAARRSRSVFHLWTHPWNLADDPGFHMAVLREILEDVARHRDGGHIKVETMGAMAERLSGRSSTGG
jgi:peptidoglycan/xylan/chitin deacetylase (PgdA/CDA1 family)